MLEFLEFDHFLYIDKKRISLPSFFAHRCIDAPQISHVIQLQNDCKENYKLAFQRADAFLGEESHWCDGDKFECDRKTYTSLKHDYVSREINIALYFYLLHIHVWLGNAQNPAMKNNGLIHNAL